MLSSWSIFAVSWRISASSSFCVWSTCWQSLAKVVAISLVTQRAQCGTAYLFSSVTEGGAELCRFKLGKEAGGGKQKPWGYNLFMHTEEQVAEMIFRWFTVHTVSSLDRQMIWKAAHLLLDLFATVCTRKADHELHFIGCIVHKLPLQSTLLCLRGPSESLV